MNPVACRMLLIALLAAPLAAQSVTSGFDAGNDGWTVNGFAYSGHLGGIGPGAPAPFDAASGLPPGSLRVGDLYGETCVQAPAAFLGDRSSWYGGTLGWDILIRFTDGADYPAAMLVGADRTLYRVLPSPPVGTWLARSVSLSEGGWRLNAWQGPAASQADMLAVLGSLQALLLNTEWKTGSDDTNVDNVALLAPATWPWIDLGGGLAGVAGVPQLTGSGTLAAGSPGSLALVFARPSSPALLWVSLASAPVPFKGGVLVAFPELVALPLVTGPAGSLLLPWAAWPAGLPAGTRLWFQYAVQDAAAVKGVALSNAVRAQTP